MAYEMAGTVPKEGKSAQFSEFYCAACFKAGSCNSRETAILRNGTAQSQMELCRTFLNASLWGIPIRMVGFLDSGG